MRNLAKKIKNLPVNCKLEGSLMYCDCKIEDRLTTSQKSNKKAKTIPAYLDDKRRLSHLKGILHVRNHLSKSSQKELKQLQAKYKLIPEVLKNLRKFKKLKN